MDIIIWLNFKHFALNIFLLFIKLAVVESITGPQREVVSIYNDNFLTPLSRPQYFIDVYRCVQVDFGECPSSGPSGYPAPKQIEKIEIVVPDITKGKDRNSTNKTKFYKYVVYNHTSCKCGTLKFRDSTLYQTITNNEVSEAEYCANCTKNPVNLIHRCHSHACKPQQRYRFTHIDAVRPSTYLAYKQCLPGSVLNNNTSTDQFTLINNKVKFVNLTSDISCKAFNGKNAEPQLCPNSITQNITPKAGKQQQPSEDGNPRDKEPNYEILVSIVSGKAILAAFLLSLVLFSILIIDLTLCRRKKGILYALLGCKNDDADNFCQRCSERSRNEITV